MNAFHAYDIRGVYNKDFDKYDVYRIGYFLPQVLKTNRILIGRDSRVSSYEIYAQLVKGITDAGADAYNLTLASTPMVYFATAQYQFDASVMITASHNSREYNGMKVSGKGACPIGYENGLNELEELVKNGIIKVAGLRGQVKRFNAKDEYKEFLMKYKGNMSSLKIAVDCCNGMACLIAKDVLGEDGIHYINDTIDGAFPNHDPNPLLAESREQLRKLVKWRKCDVGVIFDGDADRVMFLDEKGDFISPDLIIALMGHYFLKDAEFGSVVLQDIRSSKAVAEYLERFGARVETWKVGRAYASPKLKELNGLFGGELAGHYYFKDFFNSDSGVMATLIVLQIFNQMKLDGVEPSQAINNIKKSYVTTGELNFHIQDKQAAMDAVKEMFEAEMQPESFCDFDGYRLDYADWWMNIRSSNTEPYLRFIAEAESLEKLRSVIAKTKSKLRDFEK